MRSSIKPSIVHFLTNVKGQESHWVLEADQRANNRGEPAFKVEFMSPF